MGTFTETIAQLVEKLQKKLFLEFEYDSPQNYPVSFTTGLEILSNNHQSADPVPLRAFHANPNSNYPQKLVRDTNPTLKFNPQTIVPLKDGTYFYTESKHIFSDIFDCVSTLSKDYSIEELFPCISWQEFETFIMKSLEHYGYTALRTFRFHLGKKRHEVDIIARDQDRLLFIDAKHWNSKTASLSSLKTAAEKQAIRARHLIQNPQAAGELLQRLNYHSSRKFKIHQIFPIILVSSELAKNVIVEGVPILSFNRFNEFLNHFYYFKPQMQSFPLDRVELQKKLI